MSVRETYDASGDPPSGEREDDKFYAADALEHAEAINATLAAIAGLVSAEATVATSESTTSTTYTDLATTTDSVTVTIGNSGVALVYTAASITYTSGTSVCPFVSFALSGANTVAASDGTSFILTNIVTTGFSHPVSRLTIVSGLAAGPTTFKMKYRVSGGNWAFANRRISVIPLP